LRGRADIDFTPQLQQLQEEGVRLDRHHTYLWCSPTRRSFLSGRYPGTSITGTQAPQCSNFLPLQFQILPEKLAAAGYNLIYSIHPLCTLSLSFLFTLLIHCTIHASHTPHSPLPTPPLFPCTSHTPYTLHLSSDTPLKHFTHFTHTHFFTHIHTHTLHLQLRIALHRQGSSRMGDGGPSHGQSQLHITCGVPRWRGELPVRYGTVLDTVRYGIGTVRYQYGTVHTRIRCISGFRLITHIISYHVISYHIIHAG
jgi:hypothetical protein